MNWTVEDDDRRVVVPGVGTLDWQGWKDVVQAHFSGHSDFLIQITDSVEDGDTLAFLWAGTGTHDCVMPHPEGQCPPTGARLDVTGACYVTVTDGLITDYHLYFDSDDYFAYQRMLAENVEAVAG